MTGSRFNVPLAQPNPQRFDIQATATTQHPLVSLPAEQHCVPSQAAATSSINSAPIRWFLHQSSPHPACRPLPHPTRRSLTSSYLRLPCPAYTFTYQLPPSGHGSGASKKSARLQVWKNNEKRRAMQKSGAAVLTIRKFCSCL